MQVKENFEIKPLTTYKIGGKVSKLYLPETLEEFTGLLRELDNYIVLGSCSNVIFSSNGYSGNVIITTGMKNFEIKGTRVFADCGVKDPLLAQKVSEASLSGLEFLIGLPGTIGGAVYMNAGAHGQCIGDVLVSCCLYDRKTIQPSLANPNAGSVFKNPENDSAGRLLEKAGAKSFDLDRVKVWDKHANFIINKGDAASEDVLELMVKMYNAVKNMYTIELTPEQIFIGDKTKKEEELCNILYRTKTQK